tara:strand:+ start:123 stop:797 length:675 start_codon:yes stop_codon:yes gene_type:complete
MKNILKKLKRVNGQSLAEFAVTTAMMATLATTAAPKFSGVGEGAKEKKTLSDIDKILKAANNFYNTEVTEAGRGRFPGQSKFNQNVPEGGGYVSSDIELELENDLTGDDANFNNYASPLASKWSSVFGTTNPDTDLDGESALSTVEDPEGDVYPGTTNYTLTVGKGAEEFLELFGGDAIKSPFQDGHYIYTVIAGSGSGSQSAPPIIFVADLESPSAFYKKLQP